VRIAIGPEPNAHPSGEVLADRGIPVAAEQVAVWVVRNRRATAGEQVDLIGRDLDRVDREQVRPESADRIEPLDGAVVSIPALHALEDTAVLGNVSAPPRAGGFGVLPRRDGGL